MAHQTVSPRWDRDLVPTAAGRTDAPSDDCPVEVALAAVAGRWTTLLLRNLMGRDAASFSELAHELPALSDKVLADRLDRLVELGLVRRDASRGFPTRTAYRLTERGLLLRPLLVELYRTGAALQATAERPL